MAKDEMERIISSNLKRLMREHKIKQNELARIAGVSESAAGKWILGKSTPRMGAIQSIADYFNLPKSYILEEKPTNLINVSQETVEIPILGYIACGEPILVEENFEEYRTELTEGLPVGNLFYVRAKGASMSPTIPDGSYVLAREQCDVENGEIAVVTLNGNTEATLKRVKKLGDIIMLIPDNNAFSPFIVTEENPVRIIGKAMRFTQEL